MVKNGARNDFGWEALPLTQCFSTAGTRPSTGTWIIREIKNLSEITKKSSILKYKFIRKIYYWDNWLQNYNLPVQTSKKIILPGLGFKKVENHCSNAPVILDESTSLQLLVGVDVRVGNLGTCAGHRDGDYHRQDEKDVQFLHYLNKLDRFKMIFFVKGKRLRF